MEAEREAVEKLVDELRELGVTPKSSEFDVQTKKAFRALKELYRLYRDVLLDIQACTGLQWTTVGEDDLLELKSKAEQHICDHQKLPETCTSVPSYLLLHRLLSGLMKQLDLCLAALDAPLTAEHWNELFIFRGEAPAGTSFALSQLMRALDTDEHMDYLETLITTSKNDEQLVLRVQELGAQLVGKAVPLKENEADLPAVRQLLCDLADIRRDLDSVLEEAGSKLIRTQCEETLDSVDKMRCIVDSWGELVHTLRDFKELLKNPSVSKVMQQEMVLLATADTNLRNATNLMATSKNMLLSSLIDDTPKREDVEQSLEEGSGRVRKVKAQLSQSVLAACSRFPKLHFLDEQVLLQVLAAGSDLTVVRRFLPLLFSSVTDFVTSDSDKHTIQGVLLDEVEPVLFTTPLVIKEGSMLTDWITDLQHCIDTTMKKHLREVAQYASLLRDGKAVVDLQYLNQFPSGVGLVGVYLAWTSLVEGSLGISPAMRSALSKDTPGVPGLGPINQQGNVPNRYALNRPMSAQSVQRQTVLPRRPATADQRLRQLTSPLAVDSVMIRPGSANVKTKAKKEEDEKPNRAKRRSTVGRIKKKEKVVVEEKFSRKKSVVWTTPARHGAGLRCTGITEGLIRSQGMVLEEDEVHQAGSCGLPVGGALSATKCKWVTSLGHTDVWNKFSNLLTQCVALTTSFLPRLKRVQVESMINHLNYLMSVLDSDDLKRVESPEDFAWQRQLRYYQTKQTKCVIKMGGASLSYGVELHGPHTKSVVTGQTTSVWYHFLQAMTLRYGGVFSARVACMEGMRDLAALAARFAPSLLCSEHVQSAQLTSFFIGVVLTGCWGMLEDSAKLSPGNLATVSILAEHLHTARGCANLGGSSYTVSPGAAVFATVPSDRAYQPVSPELHARFRHVCVPLPDLVAVTHSLLLTSGFDNLVMASKLVSLLNVLTAVSKGMEPKLLFGHQFLRAVLQKASNLLRRKTTKPEKCCRVQDVVIVDVIKEVVLGMCSTAQADPLSAAIIDVFPEHQSVVHHMKIGEVMTLHVQSRNLSSPACWSGRILHLYELQTCTKSILMLGPTYCGKTAALAVLRDVLGDVCGEKQPEVRLYPQSFAKREFWGHVSSSFEWVEGVFATALRKLGDSSCWLVLDGRLDFAEHIQSLMSPNALFCGSLQTPIQLPQKTKFIAETDTAECALPSTVANFSIVYFDEGVLPWVAHVEKLERCTPDVMRDALAEVKKLCLKYFDDACDFMQQHTEHLVNKSCTAVSIVSLVEALLRAPGARVSKLAVMRCFWWCTSWVLMGGASQCAREAFHQQVVAQHINDDINGTLFEVAFNPLSAEFVAAEIAGPPLGRCTPEKVSLHFVPSLVAPAPTLAAAAQTCGLNVALCGKYREGKTVLCEHHLRGSKQTWLKVGFDSGASVDEVRATVGTRRYVLIDDVSMKAECKLNPLYELAKEGMGWMATADMTGPHQGAKRMLSKFVLIHCCLNVSSCVEPLRALFAEMLPAIFSDISPALPAATVTALKLLAKKTPRVLSTGALMEVMSAITVVGDQMHPKYLLYSWKRAIGDLCLDAAYAADCCDQALAECLPDATIKSGTLLASPERRVVVANAELQSVLVEAVKPHCLYPSLADVCATLSRHLLRMGSNVVLHGPPGSGRKLAVHSVAKLLNMDLAEGLDLASIKGAYKAAAEGKHIILLAPSYGHVDLQTVLKVGQGDVVGGHGAKTFKEELVEVHGEPSIGLMQPVVTHEEEDTWNRVRSVVANHLHVVLCTEEPVPELATHFTSIHIPDLTLEDAISLTRHTLGDSDLDSNAIGQAFHEAHAWVKSQADRDWDHCVRAISSTLPRALKVFKSIWGSCQERLESASFHHKLGPVLLEHSCHLMEGTGVVPKAHIPDVPYSFFEGCYALSTGEEVPVRFVLHYTVDDAKNIVDVKHAGYYTLLGERHAYCVHGEASIALSGESLKLGVFKGTLAYDELDNEWKFCGQVEGFEFSAAETMPPTEAANVWLRGEFTSGKAVDPLSASTSTSSTGKVHEFIEHERRRVWCRLSELSSDSIAGDAFVAAATLVYGPALPSECRVGLFEATKELATKHVGTVHRSADRWGMYSVYMGLPEAETDAFWLSAVANKLPLGTVWSDLAVAMTTVTHASLPEKGNVNVPFVYDPYNLFAQWMRKTEEASHEGLTDVLCLQASDPSLDGVFVDAVYRGRTVFIEGVRHEHWPKLCQFLSLHLDPAVGKASCEHPLFVNGSSYSDKFHMILVADPNSDILPDMISRCTYFDASLTGSAVGSQLAEVLCNTDQDTHAELADIVSELDAAEDKLNSAERQFDALCKGIPPPLEWYYTPEAAETLQTLGSSTLTYRKHQEKLRAFRTTSELARAEWGGLISKLVCMYEAAKDTVSILGDNAPIVSPMRLLGLVVYHATQPRAPGERGKLELMEQIIAGTAHMLLRATHPDDRLLLSALMCIKQEMAAGMETAAIRAFVSSSGERSLAEQLAYETACKVRVEAKYAQEVREANEKAALKQCDDEEAEQDKGRRPASGKPRGKGKRTQEARVPQRDLPPVNVKPAYSWLSHETWLSILKLTEVKVFAKLPEALHETVPPGKAPREQKWLEWFNTLGKIPEYEKTPMSKFERMLLTLVARPDRAVGSLRKYFTDICKHFDPYTLLPPLTPDVFALSQYNVPITFVLSQNENEADILTDINNMAALKKAVLSEKACIAMQRGNNDTALEQVRNCLALGSWVYLTNVHCAEVGFINDLATCIREHQQPNRAFRLFMSYRQQGRVPRLVSDSICITVGPARGVKNLMTALYKGVKDTTLNAMRTLEWQRLLFAVMLVAVLINERRAFLATQMGAAGTPLARGLGDAQLAVSALHQHLSALREVDKHKESKIGLASWRAVRHSLAEVLSLSASQEELATVKALVDWWVHPDVVKPGMKVCKGFAIPSDAELLSSHWQIIEAMPASDFTELFGLLPGCEVRAQQKQVERVKNCLSNTVLKGLVPQPSLVSDFLDKLPHGWDTPAMDAVAHMSPLYVNKHLLAEMRELNKLLNYVRQDASNASREIGDCVVKEDWVQWYRMRALSEWLPAVCSAREQLEKWRSTQEVPRPLLLGGLADAEGLLLAVRRDAARAWGVSLASITVANRVVPVLPTKRDLRTDGIVATNLFTAGCKWDASRQLLADTPCKDWWAEPVAQFPLLHIYASKEPPVSTPFVSLPLSICTETEPLLHVSLPSQREANYWVLRNAHIVCRCTG